MTAITVTAKAEFLNIVQQCLQKLECGLKMSRSRAVAALLDIFKAIHSKFDSASPFITNNTQSTKPDMQVFQIMETKLLSRADAEIVHAVSSCLKSVSRLHSNSAIQELSSHLKQSVDQIIVSPAMRNSSDNVKSDLVCSSSSSSSSKAGDENNNLNGCKKETKKKNKRRKSAAMKSSKKANKSMADVSHNNKINDKICKKSKRKEELVVDAVGEKKDKPLVHKKLDDGNKKGSSKSPSPTNRVKRSKAKNDIASGAPATKRTRNI